MFTLAISCMDRHHASRKIAPDKSQQTGLYYTVYYSIDCWLLAINIPTSNYFTEEEIRPNAKILTEPHSPTFSMMHLNARSLITRNFDKFKLMLANLQTPLSVIAVTETWLTNSTFDQVVIPGYTCSYFKSSH